MYLHRLELRAIGPYPDTVRIDFAALAASGVFLLEGPTGSGKSTIIDAVVFALYGGLAGADASNDRLHSQHADPAVEPSVELVFETGAGVFRVRRTPQYDRPKQRGTGTTRQQASAQLVRLADPSDVVGEPVSSRAQEVGAEIARIVGLDRAQFLQTVVLPQGEFARFLRAPGEERRKLLQSLFGTEIYDRTAAELVERRRGAAAEIESADAGVRDALSRFEQAAGVDDCTEDAVPTVLDGLRSSAVADETHRVAAVRAADIAATALRSSTSRAEALTRRADLLRRRDALDASAPVVAQARFRLDLAARAARVTAVADGHTAAVARADDAARSVADLHAEHDADLAGLDTQDIGAEADRVAGQAASVRHLVDIERALDERRAALDTAEHDAERLRSRLAELAAAVASRPAERARIVEAARSAAERATAADAAQRAVEAADAARQALTDAELARTRVADAERRVSRARSAAADALEHEHRLRERRIAGLAGELGAALEPGSACPVCGAVEHPAVAQPADDHPTADQIEAAAASARRADASLADASAELAVDRADALRLAEAVGTDDAERVAERARAAAAALRDARDAAAEVADHERRKVAHDEQTRALEDDRNDVDARLRVLVARTEADRERIATDAAAVDAARAELRAGRESDESDEGDDDALVPLADIVATLDRRTAVLRRLRAAHDAARSAAADADARSRELAQVLADAEITDVETARAAVLGRSDRLVLDGRITTADRERAVVDAGLAEASVVAAAADDPASIDLDAARAVVERTTADRNDAIRAAGTSAERLRAAEQCAEQLRRAVAVRAATSARSRAVVRLADIAAAAPGANPTGITLGTYVLMRRFEDVIAAANDRLRSMLGGRFTLEASDERETGTRARRTGLALAVRDHTTDTTRDPRSLSGGETFTFSLCLALGLADVVQAEAGGVSLGTLFVDEGFGTLDPETLDDVIGQLARLTAGGRQVGIVSHVEELKQRIPERIAVRRASHGGSFVTTTV